MFGEIILKIADPQLILRVQQLELISIKPDQPVLRHPLQLSGQGAAVNSQIISQVAAGKRNFKTGGIVFLV